MSSALHDLAITADFDSGNIEVIDPSDPERVRLAIRPDGKSGHFQWFHFQVEHMVPGQAYRFCLENAGQSTFSKGWPGYQAVASYDREHWFRVPSTFQDDTFSCTLDAEQPQAWLAYFEPYSRERHEWLIEQAVEVAGMQMLAVGKSVEGRDITLLRAGSPGPTKRKLWLIAQQHPGEHMAEWFMEGLVERLLAKDDPVLRQLLESAELYLVPHMNPDGARHGYLRTNAMGKDLNRQWQDSSAEFSPEVFFVQQQMDKYGVDLFIDVHGDEEIPYVFTAACEGNPGYTPRIAGLEARFRQLLDAQTVDFQCKHGYQSDLPCQANMTLACNAVGQRFDCLSMTLEMPFKDHDDAPNPRTGWSSQRSRQLAKDVLEVIAKMIPQLR